MSLVGAAALEVDVPVGTAMAGFAARTEPSRGVHDPLTVRALSVDDLCWVTVEVCGLHEDTCRQIAASTAIPEGVRVSATHTHSGPCVLPGRLGGVVEPVRTAIVEAAVSAVAQARAAAVASEVSLVAVPVADVAVDRRRMVPLEVDLQALIVRRADRVTAALVSFPCHPVVLDASNLQISADYPAALVARLQTAWPDAVVAYACGCAGDVNTGHRATGSPSGPSPRRTFAEADRIGIRLAEALLGATRTPAVRTPQTPVRSARATVDLDLAVLDDVPAAERAVQWRAQRAGADPSTRALLDAWIGWATDPVIHTSSLTWSAPVSVARVPGGWLVGLPGEPFLGVARAIRAGLPDPVLVLGYTDGCPGYLPLATDYAEGGYEVTEAHRYYGLPAPFGAGSAERLVATALRLAGQLG